MKTIHSRQTVDSDGMIRLAIPVGQAGEQLDVVVVLSEPSDASRTNSWNDFVHEMAGSCPDLEELPDPPPTRLEESL